LFGGYTAYQVCPKFYRKYGWMPGGVRSAAGQMLRAVPQSLWNEIIPNGGIVTPGARLHRLGAALGAKSQETVYLSLISLWEPDALVPGVSEPPTAFTAAGSAAVPEFTEKMMLLDALVYLPDDILVKVDRASMAVSLEARGPLLDYRLFEFAWRLPREFKIRDGKGKWILRDLLSRYLPREITDRPKAGFEVPVRQWLRGPLREWAEDLLDEGRIAREGLLNPAPIRQTWLEHKSGRDWSHRLWTVLMFESWLQSTRSAAPSSVIAS
jgi:asparagine synthase (glutamine-hydrolysing)